MNAEIEILRREIESLRADTVKRMDELEEGKVACDLALTVMAERQFKTDPGRALETLNDLYELAAEFRAGGLRGGESLHQLALGIQQTYECLSEDPLNGSLTSEH